MKRFYSTSAALEWLIAHYFMDGQHPTWFTPDFYPYRRRVRPTSNPLQIYKGLYEAWKEKHAESPYISQKRLALRKSIQKKQDTQDLDPELAVILKRAADVADTSFFAPIVCSLALERERVEAAESRNAEEYYLPDIQEREITLTLADFGNDAELQRLIVQQLEQEIYCDKAEVLELINNRRVFE